MRMKVVAAVDVESEGALLRKKLRPALYGAEGLELVATRPVGLADACDDSTAVGMILTTSFTSQHRQAFKRARDKGYQGPLLVVSKLESPGFLSEIRAAPNAHFLERPFDPRDLLGIVDKFVRELQVQQRIHRRFVTDEIAEVDVAGERARTVVRNLSRGGAYFEVEEGPLPLCGAEVTLRISLRDVRRTYVMPAKVVWVSLSGTDGRPGVGIEFMAGANIERMVVGTR